MTQASPGLRRDGRIAAGPPYPSTTAVQEDFASKDPRAAEKAGMPLMECVSEAWIGTTQTANLFVSFDYRPHFSVFYFDRRKKFEPF